MCDCEIPWTSSLSADPTCVNLSHDRSPSTSRLTSTRATRLILLDRLLRSSLSHDRAGEKKMMYVVDLIEHRSHTSLQTGYRIDCGLRLGCVSSTIKCEFDICLNTRARPRSVLPDDSSWAASDPYTSRILSPRSGWLRVT